MMLARQTRICWIYQAVLIKTLVQGSNPGGKAKLSFYIFVRSYPGSAVAVEPRGGKIHQQALDVPAAAREEGAT